MVSNSCLKFTLFAYLSVSLRPGRILIQILLPVTATLGILHFFYDTGASSDQIADPGIHTKPLAYFCLQYRLTLAISVYQAAAGRSNGAFSSG